MTQEQKDKIAKVYALATQGVDGEKDAAKTLLDKLIKKYNLSDDALASIQMCNYSFKYNNMMEVWLIEQLHKYFLPEKDINGYRATLNRRDVVLKLEYIDYVTIESAYEYFRRHMNTQFKKTCLPLIKRCKSTKTRNKRREELQQMFFSKYVYESKIYLPNQLRTVDLNQLSGKELKDRQRLQNIEGGQFNTQVTTGLYLE